MSMTDTNGSGATQGNPASASGDQSQPGSAAVSTAGWLGGLQQADNRDFAAKKGWDKASSPDVVFTSYRELEGRLGRAVVLPPSQNATKQDYDAFAKKVGRPEQPDGYTFKLPSDLPAGLPYDDQSATEFKVWAHEAGLAPWQAQLIHDRFVAKQVQLIAASGDGLKAKVNAAHGDIVKRWGPTDSNSYAIGVRHASRAMQNLGLAEVFRAHGLLTPQGEVTNAKLAFALATVGEGLFQEDKRHGGPGNLTAANPWKAGQENLTEQGRLWKTDPELARTLIQAAGKDPSKELQPGGR